jgi:hypothetical protein
VPAHFRTCNADATAIREGGITMLMQALQYERFDAAQALLKHGAVRAQVNLARCDGVTALMLACLYEAAADVVRMLIAAGADIMAPDHNGNTALAYAAAAGNATIIAILIASMDEAAKSNAEPFNKAFDYASDSGRDLDTIKAFIAFCDKEFVQSYLINGIGYFMNTLPGYFMDLIKLLVEAGIRLEPQHLKHLHHLRSPCALNQVQILMGKDPR